MKIDVGVFASMLCFMLVSTSFTSGREPAEHEKELNILFIGNSFTFVNSLDQTLGDMLNVSGVPAKTSRSAPGGWSFKRHFKGEIPDKYKGEPTPDAIKREKWDYVVLQEQSSAAIDHHADFMEYGKKLAELIRENNPDSKIILYQTWGRCDGMFEGYGDDAARKEEVVAAWTKRYSQPNEGTLRQLKSGMRGAYEELRKEIDSALAPVGEAFFTVGDKLDLYGDEGDQKPFHPNPRGTYLAGCVFFKTITGDSPVGLWDKLNASGKDHKVSKEDAAYLERVADEIVP